MKTVRGYLELLALLIFAHGAVATPRIIQYVDGMHLGRGVNTFTGGLKRLGAVEFSNPPASQPNVKIQCSSRRISTYEELAKSLDISVAASFGYGTVSGSAKTRVIEDTKMEETYMTYIITCSSEKQPELQSSATFKWDPQVHKPAETYGDRYISGFIEGGSLVARVSIAVKNRSKKHEVEASAQAAFEAFKFSAELSASAKNSISNVVQNSDISYELVYIGVAGGMDVSSITSEAERQSQGLDEIQQLKKLTEVFISRAAQHSWKSYAILDEYTNTQGFYPDQHFHPLDYTRAERKAWVEFNSFARFRRLLQIVRDLDSHEFDRGMEKKIKWQGELNLILDKYHDWVHKVAANPTESQQVGVDETVSSMLRKIVDSIRPHVMLFQHGDFQGEAEKLMVEYNHCVNFPKDFNDIVTSIRLTKASGVCTFYEHYSCNGRAYEMAALENTNLKDDGDINDMLSSVRCLRPDFKVFYSSNMNEFIQGLNITNNTLPVVLTDIQAASVQGGEIGGHGAEIGHGGAGQMVLTDLA
ncbi:hypothetical protein CDD81_3975 [Ophiocordyceps australis]|uniref:MACPF domain-containing protein n=1 Tax=Ophiocordyceps australis TaxID=1399860 RepID=A0A2C5XWI0_9HYPO|nr:hypothetical protein CDD81_3975 [Ophiocordyceps australis]